MGQSLVSQPTWWSLHKNFVHKAQMSFLGCQYSTHIVTHLCWKSNLFLKMWNLPGLKCSCVGSPILPHMSLPLAGSDFYPFAIINCKYKYSAFLSSVRCSGKLLNLRKSVETPKFEQADLKWGCPLRPAHLWLVSDMGTHGSLVRLCP